MKKEDVKFVKRQLAEFGDSFWAKGNDVLFEEIVDILNKQGVDLRVVDLRDNPDYMLVMRGTVADDDEQYYAALERLEKLGLYNSLAGGQ